MVLTNLGVAALVRNGVKKKAERLELHKEKEKQNFLKACKCGSTRLAQRLVTKMSS